MPLVMVMDYDVVQSFLFLLGDLNESFEHLRVFYLEPQTKP